MTDRLEEEAMDYIRKIDDFGGMVEAVERGYPQREIAGSAYRLQRQIESGEKTVVGVNKYEQDGDPDIPTLRVDESIQKEQVESLAKLKAERDDAAVSKALAAIADACTTDRNVMPSIIDAAKAYCTEQEICDVFRGVFGQHQDRPEF
jgi:methylmalonyl-CoA mutase N-terminal domain/subunit